MDASYLRPLKSLKEDADKCVELDIKQIFFTNLQLLGLNAAAMEMKWRIPFNKDMFNLPNKAGAEAVLYFLFERLNPVMCRQEFRDCWPVDDKKTEQAFRRISCIWLQNIQKEEAGARLPRINTSLFLSPGGDKFYQLIFAFSTYVLLCVIKTENGVKEQGLLRYPILTSQNKDLGPALENMVHCTAIRHRKQFIDTLQVTISSKQQWQSYADELTKELRRLLKDIRDLERSRRAEVQCAAQKGTVRGSPVPAARQCHTFDLDSHSAKRALRVQQVRGMWKSVENYIQQSIDQKEIVASVVDKTLQRYTIDCANIQISVPHLMLINCEQELQRRQVDNVYEGGQLNLVSVLQLWNLALGIYRDCLHKAEIKDLSYDAARLENHVHTHQAYLANATVLREKMAKDLPKRKKTVSKLHMHFQFLSPPSGLGLSAPSPPVTFNPPSGHSDSTPQGPFLRLTPDLVSTPEAAQNIANTISKSSCKNLNEPFRTTSLGFFADNTSNNNAASLLQPGMNESKIPQATSQMSSLSGPTFVKINSQTKASEHIEPRVIRHVSRQKSAVQKTNQKTDWRRKKEHVENKKFNLASTPQRASLKQPHGHIPDRVPTMEDKDLTETPHNRALSILADKIAHSVMQTENDSDIYGPDVLRLQPAINNSGRKQDISLNNSTISGNSALSQNNLQINRISQTQRPSTLSDSFLTREESPYRTFSHNERGSSLGKYVQDSEIGMKRILSHQFEVTDSFHSSHDPKIPDVDKMFTGDLHVQDPASALSESIFESHDIIHRSPLEKDIRRMWKEILSASPEKLKTTRDNGKESSPHSDRSSPVSQQVSPSTHKSRTISTESDSLSSETFHESNFTDKKNSLDQTHSSFVIDGIKEKRKEMSDETKEKIKSSISLSAFKSSEYLQNCSHSDMIEATSEDHYFPLASNIADALEKKQTKRLSLEDSEKIEQIESSSTKETGSRKSSLMKGSKQKADTIDRSLTKEEIETSLNSTLSFEAENSSEGECGGDKMNNWEERTSALYDDDVDFAESVITKRLQPMGSSASYEMDMDDLFQTKTPVPFQDRDLGKYDSTLKSNGNHQIPLIAFSPPQSSDTQPGSTNNSHGSLVDLEKLFTSECRLAPDQQSDNCTQECIPTSSSGLSLFDEIAGRKNTKQSSGQQKLQTENSVIAMNHHIDEKQFAAHHSASDSPTKQMSSDYNSNISREFLQGSYNDGFAGTWSLDDSFTPLQNGLVVEVKMQARQQVAESSSKTSHCELPCSGGLSSNFNTYTKENHQKIWEDISTEDIAARLSKLQEMKAQALSVLSENKADSSHHRKGGIINDRDNERTATTVNSNLLLFDSSLNDFTDISKDKDIFDEDDSVLLPASPT